MAKKQKSKKKIETKTITKKDIDKLLEDNNIVVDEKKEVKPEEKKEKLKRTKRNAALYEKEKVEEQEINDEVEVLDIKKDEEIQEEILEDIEEVKELEEEIEKLDNDIEEEKGKTAIEAEENHDEDIQEVKELEEEIEKLDNDIEEEKGKTAIEAEEDHDEDIQEVKEEQHEKEEVKSLLSDDILEDEMDTSFLTHKSNKQKVSINTFKDNYNVLITVIFVLMIIFVGFLIFHYTTFNHHKVKVVTKIKEVEKVPDNYLFLGDSITDFYDLDKYYPDMPTVNSGVSGNTTEDILKDMKKRAYQYNPSKVFLLIGTNDLDTKHSKEDIVNNVEKIISELKENRPKAELYIESIYPVNPDVRRSKSGNRNNDDIKQINKELKKYCKENKINYINLYDLLKDEDDNLKEEYTKDGLHLSDEGYKVVTEEIKKKL